MIVWKVINWGSRTSIFTRGDMCVKYEKGQKTCAPIKMSPLFAFSSEAIAISWCCNRVPFGKVIKCRARRFRSRRVSPNFIPNTRFYSKKEITSFWRNRPNLIESDGNYWPVAIGTVLCESITPLE